MNMLGGTVGVSAKIDPLHNARRTFHAPILSAILVHKNFQKGIDSQNCGNGGRALREGASFVV